MNRRTLGRCSWNPGVVENHWLTQQTLVNGKNFIIIFITHMTNS